MSDTGRSLLVGYEQTSSAWGTAVPPGANDKILVKTLGPLIDPADMAEDLATGYQWKEYIDKTNINTTPEIVMQARWTGRQWSPVAQLIGLDTPVGPTNFTHTMTLLEAIDGSDNFGTLAAEWGGDKIIEWPSVKPTGFTFEGPDDQGFMSLSIRTIADCALLGADCTTVAGDIDALTHIALATLLPKRIPFGCVSFKMNAQSGGDVTSETAMAIRRVSFTFDRGFSPERVARAALASAWKSAEPIESGIPKSTLEIELADTDVLTYLENYQDETTQKAIMAFTYGANNVHTWTFPSLKPLPPDLSGSGPERIPSTLSFECLKAQSAPTGMTGITKWQFVLQDQHDTAYE